MNEGGMRHLLRLGLSCLLAVVLPVLRHVHSVAHAVPPLCRWDLCIPFLHLHHLCLS